MLRQCLECSEHSASGRYDCEITTQRLCRVRGRLPNHTLVGRRQRVESSFSSTTEVGLLGPSNHGLAQPPRGLGGGLLASYLHTEPGKGVPGCQTDKPLDRDAGGQRLFRGGSLRSGPTLCVPPSLFSVASCSPGDTLECLWQETWCFLKPRAWVAPANGESGSDRGLALKANLSDLLKALSVKACTEILVRSVRILMLTAGRSSRANVTPCDS